MNNYKKQTSRWNDEIEKQIKSKKKWKIYLGNKTEDNYNKYKSQQRVSHESISKIK